MTKHTLPTIRNHRQGGFTLIELTVVLLVLVAIASLVVPYVSDTGRSAACQTTDATLATVRDAIMGGAATPGYLSDMGHIPDNLNDLLTQGANLKFNPVTQRGWRGPYLLNAASINNKIIEGTEFAENWQKNPDDGKSNFTDLTKGFVTASSRIIDNGMFAILDHFIHSYSGGVVPNFVWRNPIIVQIPTANALNCKNVTNDYPSYTRLVSAGPNGILETKLDDAGACGRGDDRVLFLKTADPGNNQLCNN